MPAWSSFMRAVMVAFCAATSSGSTRNECCDAAPFHVDVSNLLQVARKPHLTLPIEEDPLLAATPLVDDHSITCHAVFLTAVLSTKSDLGCAQPGAAFFDKYMRFISKIPGGRVKAVILHDALPENVTGRLAQAEGPLSFVKVNVTSFDPRVSLDDLLFLLYEEQVKQHLEWSTVFMSNEHDVKAFQNPCVLVGRHPDKAFVHSQKRSTLAQGSWTVGISTTLGGEHYGGFIGGGRLVVLDMLAKLRVVILDPEKALTTEGRFTDLSIAPVNHVLRKDFSTNIAPFQSQRLLHTNWTDIEFALKE